MAGKKGQNNFDALGSIFDFIFTEAKKPPEKRKPIKPTEMSGTSLLVDGIAAALERPGAYLTEEMVEEFNGVLDLELKTLKFDEFGKVEIKTNSLIDILRDPQKAVQGAIDKNKAIKNSMKVKYLGGMMNEIIYSGWAQKYGNLEAKKALYGASLAGEKMSEIREKGVIAGAIGQAKTGRFINKDTTEFVTSRASELARKKLLNDTQWEVLSESERAEFMRKLSRFAGEANPKLGIRASNEFSDLEPLLFKAGLSSSQIDKNLDALFGLTGGADFYDPKAYLNLEKDNIKQRLKPLQEKQMHATLTADERQELSIYRKTEILLNGDPLSMDTTDGYEHLFKGQRAILEEIEDIKLAMKLTNDSDVKKQLERELKDAKGALRTFNAHGFVGRLGQWEGYMNSLKNIYGEGKLATSILKGDFFDKNKNTVFCPTSKLKLDIDGAEIEIWEAQKEFYLKGSKKGKEKGLINGYNEMGATLYYFTPRSIFRTLFYNGEGFNYILFKQIESNKALGSAFKGLGLDSPKEIFSFLMKSKKRSDIEALLTKKGIGAADPVGKVILKFFDSSEGLRKVARFTSNGARLKTKIQEALTKRFGAFFTKTRAFISDKFLMKFVEKYGEKAMLQHWVAKGSLNALVKSISTAIAGALGLAATPLGSVVVFFVSGIITDVVMKSAAVLINITKYVVLGLLGVIILILGFSTHRMNNYFQRNAVAHTVIPGDVKMCDLYEFTPLAPGETTPWGPAIIPPPSDEECILDTPSPTCTQGWVGDNLFSHGGIKSLMPIDLAAGSALKYVYAPQFCDTGDCRITQVSQINCKIDQGKYAGGAVIFEASTGSVTYTFRMYHVRPLASVNEKISGGQAVASVQDYPEIPTDSFCWTAAHIHFEVKQNGSPINPLELLREFKCSVYEKSCP